MIVKYRTYGKCTFGVGNIVDESSHECLDIGMSRRLISLDVIDMVPDLFVLPGAPGHIRFENGPKFIAKVVQERITAVDAKTANRVGHRGITYLQLSPR